jgi:hypothetical protein
MHTPLLLRLGRLVLGCILLVLPASAVDVSRLANGGFEEPVRDRAWPVGWVPATGATWEKEGTNHFLRLTSPAPGAMVMVFNAVPMRTNDTALKLTFRERHTDVQPGKQSWFDARIMMNFKDAAGAVLKPGPAHPNFRGSSPGWQNRTVLMAVPTEARQLEVMLTLFQAKSGTIDFDDLSLVPISPAELPPPKPAKPVVVAPPSRPMTFDPARLPAPLKVVGAQLQTLAGKPVWLQGLCVDSLEWTAGGENIQRSLKVAISEWKANVIRLPVSEEFWFGRNQWQNDGGVAYRKLVDAAIATTAEQGAYLVLDLHRFGAPLPVHADFWRDAATRYQNHPAVVLELFNEAHGIPWSVWRDGGELKPKTAGNADVNVAENNQKVAGDRSVGMQGLLDAIRATGARNVVIAGGLDWGYDLSGVTQGFALRDQPRAQGIVYSSHIYPWKGDWAGKVLVAAEKYPLFIGEVGCPLERMSFIPAERHEDPYVWAPDMLGLIQKHRLHWTGFSFHPKCAPMVISDWNYTPTPYWGAFVKQALQGQPFILKKLR